MATTSTPTTATTTRKMCCHPTIQKQTQLPRILSGVPFPNILSGFDLLLFPEEAPMDPTSIPILSGSWAALPIHLQRRILLNLEPQQLVRLATVSKQVGRLALALLRDLHVELIDPPAGAGKEDTAPSCWWSHISQEGLTSYAPWLRRHGHRIEKLVITTDSHAVLDALLESLAQAAVANCDKQHSSSFFQQLFSSAAAEPAAHKGSSTKPQIIRSSSLRLKQLELTVPALQRSSATKLATICQHAPGLQVLVAQPMYCF